MVNTEATDTRFMATQLPIDFITNVVVLNAWYEVAEDLSGGRPCKFFYIIVEQNNNGGLAETIELELTIRHPVTGVATVLLWTLAAIASADNRYCLLSLNQLAAWFETVNVAATQQVMADNGDQSAQFSVGWCELIRVRQTTAVDVVAASIEVNIVWDMLYNG